jgi:uncharacterized protein (DUF486 family)
MPVQSISSYLLPIFLLAGSNVFMTTAWYWHLRYKEVPLISVIFISWGLAFVEYCMAVPANRLGSAIFSPAQLKTIQEVVTLLVFAIFSIVYLKNPLTWGQGFGFLLIAAGAFFVFKLDGFPPYKIEFSFLNGNLMVLAGRLPILLRSPVLRRSLRLGRPSARELREGILMSLKPIFSKPKESITAMILGHVIYKGRNQIP